MDSRTTTFLLSDIEGSTRLLNELGRARFGEVMRIHQQLLRAVLQESGGEEINTYGDAFFAAFRSAADAIAAAAAAQRALHEHPWPDGRRVLVRMGLNTGEGVIAGESYVGVAVHRAARLCAIAQGGQVLLSQATNAIVSDEPLEGLGLRDLGERRLKDFEHPERVSELLIDGLPRASAAASRARATIRLVLADDSVLMREGLARVLTEKGFDVVSQVSDGESLLEAVRREEPDVAIVDIRMPPSRTDEGVRAALALRQEYPRVGILLFSQSVETRQSFRLLTEMAEGVGYLLKDRVAEIDDFADAIRRIARGGSAVDPEVVSQLLRRRATDGALEKLTEAELEVLALMAEGLANEEICERLGLDAPAVNECVGDIFSKLQIQQAPTDRRRLLAVLAYLGE